MPHYDYDKDYPFAAFITNLGKYNEGALVGEWVKFPTTLEELKKVFERIGIGAKDDFGQTYEEWFITDYDCYVDGLYDLLGEYANLDELNHLTSKLDYMSQDEYERFQAVGYGFHHETEDGKYLIMTNGSRTFAIPNGDTPRTYRAGEADCSGGGAHEGALCEGDHPRPPCATSGGGRRYCRFLSL